MTARELLREARNIAMRFRAMRTERETLQHVDDLIKRIDAHLASPEPGTPKHKFMTDDEAAATDPYDLSTVGGKGKK